MHLCQSIHRASILALTKDNACEMKDLISATEAQIGCQVLKQQEQVHNDQIFKQKTTVFSTNTIVDGMLVSPKQLSLQSLFTFLSIFYVMLHRLRGNRSPE